MIDSNSIHEENCLHYQDTLASCCSILPAVQRCRRLSASIIKPGIHLRRAVASLSQAFIGRLLTETGKPAEALTEQQKALDILQKLAEANPTVPDFRRDLAFSHELIGRLHARQKRFAEAFAALDRALVLRQKLADADPKNTKHIADLGDSHASRGWAHVRAGHPAEAAAALRRALAQWEKGKAADTWTLFERARALALLARLTMDGKSGVTQDEAKTFADQSVAALADALKAGWGQYDELKEPDFDSVRGRADIQKLIAEVEAKAETVLETAPPPREKK
jgi:tetratricopeptide (TPR) repeat protein